MPTRASYGESKETLAAATFRTVHRKIKDLLRTVLRGGGIERTDAPVGHRSGRCGGLRDERPAWRRTGLRAGRRSSLLGSVPAWSSASVPAWSLAWNPQ